jgi:glutamate racemase
LKASNPIGIFDSGTGGLTVAKAVKEHLPNEQIVYFGDSAHLPYGDKSTATIQSYAIKITDVLLKHHCKVILIACNSASAAAYDLIKAYVGSKAKVINVIDPVSNYVSNTFSEKNVGLIGTLHTVNSKVFHQKLIKKVKQFHALATPLLVPMIEEQFVHNNISKDVISTYLSDDKLANIDALILGCTHYPIIKDEINDYYGGKVNIIDSAQMVSAALMTYLERNDLLNTEETAKDKFLVSDYTEAFEKAAQFFFGDEISLEKYTLWE